MFGPASFEDLTLKGYDIVANAIGSLDKSFELTFVGSSPGRLDYQPLSRVRVPPREDSKQRLVIEPNLLVDTEK